MHAGEWEQSSPAPGGKRPPPSSTHFANKIDWNHLSLKWQSKDEAPCALFPLVQANDYFVCVQTGGRLTETDCGLDVM